MKKIVIAVALLMSSSLALMSCDNGAYDADPNSTNNNPPIINPPSGGGGGSSSFNWNGTAPMSAKVDGVPFLASSDSYGIVAGMTMISAAGPSSDFMITFTTPVTVGTFNFSNTLFANYNEGANMFTAAPASGGSGGIKILVDDATHVEGKFYGTFKSQSGVTKVVTEGYFNIQK